MYHGSMKAVRLRQPTPGSAVVLETMPVPAPRPGWVLVEVKSFGLNDSERSLRQSEIEQSWIPKPVVPGVECAGIVVDGGGGPLRAGERVIACMGGMGCAFDGSYAQFVSVPASQAFTLPGDLEWSWEQLGAFPETYLTAWGSLIECLQVEPADQLLVRGATCSVGAAAIQIARSLSTRVLGTTHRPERVGELYAAGVERAFVDDGALADRGERFDKVLDLVGPRSLRDSLQCTRPGGAVCSTGFLGGQMTLDDFDPTTDIPNGVHLCGYSSNAGTQEVYDDIISFMTSFGIEPIVGSVFGFEDIAEALKMQDAGARGKIVVVCS